MGALKLLDELLRLVPSVVCPLFILSPNMRTSEQPFCFALDDL